MQSAFGYDKLPVLHYYAKQIGLDSVSVTSCENASSECYIYVSCIDFLYLDQQRRARDRAPGVLTVASKFWPIDIKKENFLLDK
jgi:hypothetical protein